MILYANDIVLLCDNVNDIVKIYDAIFPRFGLKISTGKTKTMAFNVEEEIKAKTSLISIGDIPFTNVCSFKYLGHMIVNTGQQ